MKKLIQHKIQTGALQSAIFNSANFSSIATDAKGVIQIFNAGAERMLGYAAADVMNKLTPADISDPQEVIARAKVLSVELATPIRPGFEALVFKASRGIEDIYELTYIRKDGSRFPAVVSVTALRDAQDGIIGYLLIGTDNTARKRAEETLGRNEESLAVTLNSIGDAVLTTDAEGRVTRLNPVAEKLMGWTQAEALGRPVAEVLRIINEVTRQPAVIPVGNVLATGEIHGLANHTILIARDGTERPIADSAAPIRDKDGLILGVVLVFRDVTEEKKAEKLIRESELRLRILNEELECQVEERTAEVRQALATLDATEDGAFIFDPETLRYTYVNTGAIRQLGYTREELLGMTAVDFKPEFTEAHCRELLVPMLRGEVRPHRFTTLHRHKDGHDIPVEINLQYVAPAGERPRFVAIARDITERKREEKNLRRMATVVRDSNDAITIQDFAGRITAWNRGAELMYGYSEAEALLMNIERLTTPGKVAEQKEFIRRLITGEAITSFETQRVTKDGRVLDVWMTVTKLMDEAGKPIGLASTERDITARKREAELLRENEEKWRVLFNESADGLILANPAIRTFLSVNQTICRMLGYTEAELLTLGVAGIHPPADLPVVLEAFRQQASGERKVASGLPMLRKDGSVFLADVTAEMVVLAGEHLLLGSFRDVTERQRAEEAQRASSAYARSLIEASLDPLVTISADGKITDVNEASAQATGVPREQLIGTDFSDYFTEPDQARAGYRRVFAEGFVRDYPLAIRHVSGRVMDVLYNASVYKDDQGHVLGVFAAARDITERKREEKNLRRMATVVRDSNDAITIQDFAGRITAWNRGAELMYGYSEAEALLMNIERLTTPGKVAEQKEFIRRLITGEAITSFETQRVTKDGRVLDVWMTVTKLMDEAGKPIGLASTERDITARLKNERLALRTQRLESIGTLAGGIAHDLNNALAPIMMSGELLRMQYPGESPILDIVQTSAKRGADMVKQLLSFAKGAEGERVPLQPGRLVKELEKLMKGSFPKDLQLVIKCDPQLPLVLGDATQLHQVLLNLCVNARDAMPHGGTLTLEAERQEVDAMYASSIPDAKSGQHVVLRVRDTGTGIPPENLDRIFDPFFTTKGPDKGTGLGLSTVMGIVKGHGGFLRVYSQPGQGSTFAAYLPVGGAGSDTEHVTKAAVAFRGQGETILFVDDERALREVTSAVLRRLNFAPLTATDGADGLIQAALHRTQLHAIITDLHMPHMGGLEFVRALRRMLPDIPVLVASGRMDDAVAEEFETLGVTNRLDKPFTEAQLAEALKNLLAPQ